MLDHHTPRLAPQSPALQLLRVRLVLLGMAFLFCCSPALDILVRSWSEQDEYGFRFMVPLLAAAWVWHDRKALRLLAVEPALGLGSAFLSTAGLALALGRLAASTVTQELALVAVAAALVLLLFGARFLQRLALPLIFLALMAPLLDPLLERLHMPFQLFAAAVTEHLLTLVGVPVLRTGRFLELPRVTLEVAEACSGVRFLVSTFVLAVPLAFITQRTRTKRLLLLLIALSVGIAANPLRVAVIALWAHYTDSDVHGPLHLFHGYAVYLVGLGLLFGAALLLQGRRGTDAGENPAAVHAQGGFERFLPFNQAWFLSFSILIAAGLAVHWYTPQPVPLNKDLATVPWSVDGWYGVASENESSDPDVQKHVQQYRNQATREVTVTAEYLPIQTASRKLPSPALHRSVDSREEVRLVWYRVNGRTLPDRAWAKWWNAVDGVLHRRNNGGMVLLSCRVKPGEREAAARDLRDLAEKLRPSLNECMP